MNIPPELLPGFWLWVANALLGGLLAVAVTRAPWGWLAGRSVHAYLGTIVGLLLIWTLRASVDPGLGFHFLGATLLTLMFGWELALIAVGLVCLGIAVNLGGGWTAVSVNVLVEGVVPILFTLGALKVAQRYLPHHLFIYIFVNGFFASAFAVLLSGVANALLLGAAGAYSLEHLQSEYLAFLPLLMFSEAWLTGMLVALLVVYRPQWIHTFDDETYLRSR